MLLEDTVMIMDYDMFVQEIQAIVKQKMGKDFNVKLYCVTKNNSVELDSLVLLKEGRNFVPNIYLKPYYEAYLNGTKMDDIANSLCSVYNNTLVPIVREDFQYSYEEMKPYIVFRLVNFNKNKRLLTMIPHMKYLDLAITFHCLVRDDEEGIGTIRITREHMELWKADLEEVYQLAVHNTKRIFPATIRSMEEVIMGMITPEINIETEEYSNELLYQVIGKPTEHKQNMMYILSNHKGINGATCMLYENTLREFAEKVKSDFYILPSSIHELILIPMDNKINAEELTRMVQEVNQTQVEEEEVLSNHVYYYSKAKKALIM